MKRIIGIMGAMPEEIDGVLPLLANSRKKVMGKRTYISGEIDGIETVVVFSRWGKVAAAATVTALIHEFGITELIFTGVAGAIHTDLNIGDIVIAKRLIQHDIDARPLMKQYEVPLLSKTFFDTDESLTGIASAAVQTLLDKDNINRLIGSEKLQDFYMAQPKLYTGDIASGDQFFAANAQKEKLNAALPTVLCIEMEGAAVAQVCFEYDIPFCIIRSVSDAADDRSHIDFMAFIKEVSSRYSTEIIKNIYAIKNTK